MKYTKTIMCHDCGTEVKILDKDEELELNDIRFCPICGGNNIETE